MSTRCRHCHQVVTIERGEWTHTEPVQVLCGPLADGKQAEVKRPFEHDCDGCVYLGADEEYDFYCCGKGPGATVIARFSDEGPDYASGAEHALAIEQRDGPDSDYVLVRALRLAREKGLMPPRKERKPFRYEMFDRQGRAPFSFTPGPEDENLVEDAYVTLHGVTVLWHVLTTPGRARYERDNGGPPEGGWERLPHWRETAVRKPGVAPYPDGGCDMPYCENCYVQSGLGDDSDSPGEEVR